MLASLSWRSCGLKNVSCDKETSRIYLTWLLGSESIRTGVTAHSRPPAHSGREYRYLGRVWPASSISPESLLYD